MLPLFEILWSCTQDCLLVLEIGQKREWRLVNGNPAGFRLLTQRHSARGQALCVLFEPEQARLLERLCNRCARTGTAVTGCLFPANAQGDAPRLRVTLFSLSGGDRRSRVLLWGKHTPAWVRLVEEYNRSFYETDEGKAIIRLQDGVPRVERSNKAFQALGDAGWRERELLAEKGWLAACLREGRRESGCVRIGQGEPPRFLGYHLVYFEAAPPRVLLTMHFLPQIPQQERRERQLSAREREVLAHMCAGEDNRAIADALGIAVSTVSRTVHNVYRKLGVRTRAEACQRRLAGRCTGEPE